MASLFEGYERRIDQINAVLNSYGISSIEEAEKITKDAGLNVYDQVKKIQPICFENACWAYTVGAAIAIKKGCKRAADAAAAIGEGLQAFCIPGSVADHRKVGLGHGNLGKMLLEEETYALNGYGAYASTKFDSTVARDRANLAKKGYNYSTITWYTGALQGYGLIKQEGSNYTYIYAGYDWTYSSNKSAQIWDYMCCYNVKADEVVELVYDFTVSVWTTTTPLA